MSKVVFVIHLEKSKVRKPACKPGGPMRDAKAYRRKKKHSKKEKDSWE